MIKNASLGKLATIRSGLPRVVGLVLSFMPALWWYTTHVKPNNKHCCPITYSMGIQMSCWIEWL